MEKNFTIKIQAKKAAGERPTQLKTPKQAKMIVSAITSSLKNGQYFMNKNL